MQFTKPTASQSMMKTAVLTVVLFFASGAFANDFMPDTLLKPTVSFTGAPATASIADTFIVTATDESESGKTATITATGSCTVPAGSEGGTVTVTMTKSTGSCTLKASWAADAKYAAATATQKTTATIGYAESVIYPFYSQSPDGMTPSCNGMIMDKAGNIYGTTPGSAGTGTLGGGGAVFEVSPVEGGGWTEKVLFLFNPESTGFNGYYPCGTLAFDSKGNLYGTTMGGGNLDACVGGGTTGCGTVYELTPSETGYWTPTLIYAFNGGNTDGFWPRAGVTLGSTTATTLYGTTGCGGTGVLLGEGGECEIDGGVPVGAGTVYELAYTKPTKTNKGGWEETVLLSFAGNESTTSGANVGGFSPLSGVLLKSGNLYGGTQSGGEGGGGVVYELEPGAGGWTENVLYNFCSQPNCGDGAGPMYGVPAMDSTGNLYGTGNYGGVYDKGAIWELVSSAATKTYTEKVLYSFGTNLNDGTNPSWGIVPYKTGWYGTTGGSNTSTCGTAFSLAYSASTGWQENNLWQFNGQSDVCEVGYNQLIVDTKGNFYGMGMIGPGPNSLSGGVFEISPK
ncbi:MAG: choice-of-anchor tandem repeat GloVer-containing protein [Terriglobales bacterium]